MKTTNKKTEKRAYRDLMLDISEMTEDSNIWGIALKMMKKLREGNLTNWQFEQLNKELECTANKLGINTACEELKISLF